MAACAAIAVALAGAPAAHAKRRDTSNEVGALTQDVYIARDGVLVNPTEATSSSTHLFNAAGAELGITWGQWRGASATSTAWTTGGVDRRTSVAIDLHGLIPHGVYSLFYETFEPDSLNPACPNVERTLPLTAVKSARQQPDEASFVADPTGAASFGARVDGNLLAAAEFVIFAIYHADGHTYGDVPTRQESFTRGENCRTSYGLDAARQLFILQKLGSS